MQTMKLSYYQNIKNIRLEQDQSLDENRGKVLRQERNEIVTKIYKFCYTERHEVNTSTKRGN